MNTIQKIGWMMVIVGLILLVVYIQFFYDDSETVYCVRFLDSKEVCGNESIVYFYGARVGRAVVLEFRNFTGVGNWTISQIPV